MTAPISVTAPAALAFKDYPNFVVVEKAGQVIEVQELTTQATVNARGVQGPPGPAGGQGPTGPAGSNSLAALTDVSISNPTNNQFLKLINSVWTNVNTETLDGGNF